MKKKYIPFFLAFLLLFILIMFKWSLLDYNYNIMIKIKDSAYTHDSGPLVISSAIYSVLHGLLGACLFVFLYIITTSYFGKMITTFWFHPIFLFIYMGLIHLLYKWYGIELDWLPNYFASLFILIFLKRGKSDTQMLLRIFTLSVQFFLALHWLNLIPLISKFGFGATDIPTSIRIASLYLKNSVILDFLGFAFFGALMVSATLSTILFLSFDRYISIAESHHENEKIFRSKVFENRIYEEIHALTHDLKTPLVTIRGLSSLIPLSKDLQTISTYADRIDGAAQKMSDMISSFLYDTFREKVFLSELIDILKAQLPLHDIDIEFEVRLPKPPLELNVNKIRMVRALINIVENSIMAETLDSKKKIELMAIQKDSNLFIRISDNGMGISDKDKMHIFEIGYSSKGTTGLGLAFAKKVIEDHLGRLTLLNTSIYGTQFQIQLPLSDNEQMKEKDNGI